jgi:hypothetical protein
LRSSLIEKPRELTILKGKPKESAIGSDVEEIWEVDKVKKLNEVQKWINIERSNEDEKLRKWKRQKMSKSPKKLSR